MNREQRRTYEKNLRAKGISKEAAQKFVEYNQRMESVKPLEEGTKVKLKVEQIKSHPDWERLQDTYKQFVQDNTDVVFTVEYDERHKNNPVLICLKEDTTPAKWLWWVGDLEVVK